MQKRYYSVIVLLISFLVNAQTSTTSTSGTKTTTTTTSIGISPMRAPIDGGGGGGGYQWNADRDHDGYGDPNDYVFSYTQPFGYVSNPSDLDDSNANITNIPPQTFLS